MSKFDEESSKRLDAPLDTPPADPMQNDGASSPDAPNDFGAQNDETSVADPMGSPNSSTPDPLGDNVSETDPDAGADAPDSEGEATESDTDALWASIASEGTKTKTKRKKIVFFSILGAILIAFGVFAYFQLLPPDLSYVVTINGQKVNAEDYKLFRMLAQDGGSREDAIEGLKIYYALEQAAKDMGITLTEEEEATVRDNAANLRSSMVNEGLSIPDVPDERLFALLSIDTLYPKIAKALYQSVEVDPVEFSEAFADYRENYKEYYLDIQLKFVIADTMEAAQEAHARLQAGDAPDAVIREFTPDMDPTEEIQTVGLSQLPFDEETVDEILSLKVSEFTPAMDLNGVYGVFIVDSIKAPPDADLEAFYRQLYIDEKRPNFMQNHLDEWIAALTVEINEEALEAMDTQL